MIQRFLDDLDTFEKGIYEKLTAIGMTDSEILKKIIDAKADVLLKRTSLEELDNLFNALSLSKIAFNRIIDKGTL